MNEAEAHRLAAEAAAAWGGSDSLRLIGLRENAVFEARFPAGRAALRIHRQGYQTEDAIRSELWWCDALAAKGVAVARPMRPADGSFMVHLADGRVASAFGWVGGDPLGEADKPLTGSRQDQAEKFSRLGRLLAAMHVATDHLHLPAGFQRPRWDDDGLLGESPFWGRFWEHPALTPDEAAEMRRLRAWCRDRLAEYSARGGDRGLIHADVLRENVLLCNDQPWLIDFDDSGFGYRLYDLGTALAQNLAEPQFSALSEALVAGYGDVRPLDASDIAMVPVFTLIRCLASVGWAMPRLAPAAPRHRQHIDRALSLGARLC
ncbi:MAG: phosphotransferase [Paracoccaceae bacterium]